MRLAEARDGASRLLPLPLHARARTRRAAARSVAAHVDFAVRCGPGELALAAAQSKPPAGCGTRGPTLAAASRSGSGPLNTAGPQRSRSRREEARRIGAVSSLRPGESASGTEPIRSQEDRSAGVQREELAVAVARRARRHRDGVPRGEHLTVR